MSTTILYTGKTHTTRGREGSTRSSDGALDVRLSSPGSGRPGTNPEQLFAAGWSACYLSAIGIAASEHNLRLADDASVDAEVDLAKGDDGYSLRARLHVNLPGIDRTVAEALVERAHQTCPYSKAIHGNIEVVTTIA
jgi:lipoyl-dependent peroxiredoxin